MFRLHSSAALVRVRHYICLSSLVYEGTVAYCEGGRPHKVLINIIETLLFHVLNLTTLDTSFSSSESQNITYLHFKFHIRFEDFLDFTSRSGASGRRLDNATPPTGARESDYFKLNQFPSTWFVAAMIWFSALTHKQHRPSTACRSAVATLSPDWLMHTERDMVRWTPGKASPQQSLIC